MNILIVSAALVLYLASAGLLMRRLALGFQVTQESKFLPLGIGLAAIVLHGWLVYDGLVVSEGLSLSFFNMLSLTLWMVAALVVLSAFGQPVENLGIAVQPLAGLGLLAQVVAPEGGALVEPVSTGLEVHILLSVLSYSLLAIAALQALLLAVQDRHLRNRHPGGFIRALPPLETMETLLFRLIATGFLLLTLSLLSGMVYVEDLFAQHLVHKTVLSIAAWAVFAVLLWGRWRSGWRGRTAIRWTLGGFAVLAIAYFGSKLVLELVLGRPWG